MSEFKFVDQLPIEKPSRNEIYVSFAAALRENPGCWAEWPRQLRTKEIARTTAKHVCNGALKNFPVGEFEATHRENVVFARYIGSFDE